MSVPVAHLGRRYRFSASHRLHASSLSETANQTTYGKCNNPHGHGHNYIVEVVYSGPVDENTGMVADLGALDAFAREHVLEPFNFQNLNTLDFFANLVPTTENLCSVLYGIFKKFPHAKLENLHVEETANNSFDLGSEARRAARS